MKKKISIYVDTELLERIEKLLQDTEKKGQAVPKKTSVIQTALNLGIGIMEQKI